MAENTDDKGYRRMLSDKRNFCDFVKNHIAARCLFYAASAAM